VDIAALAGALVAAQVGQVQLAVAGRILRMNTDAQASVVKLLDSAQQNMNSLANVGAGIGTSLDISA
jgi:hypothetical protein